LKLVSKSTGIKDNIYIDMQAGKDFANYKDEALEISPTIVYTSTAVF